MTDQDLKMENMESKNNTEWQELIEEKDFDQLSNEEKSFVLGISSESDFRMERAVLVESRLMNEDLEPLPLILDEEKKGILIPLYQTVLAVAAAFVIAFFLFRSNENVTETNNEPVLAKADTVYVEKVLIDTVIRTKTEYVQIAAQEPKRIEREPTAKVESSSAVLSNQESFQTDLSSTTLANKGTSASNDETMILVQDWAGPN